MFEKKNFYQANTFFRHVFLFKFYSPAAVNIYSIIKLIALVILWKDCFYKFLHKKKGKKFFNSLASQNLIYSNFVEL